MANKHNGNAKKEWGRRSKVQFEWIQPEFRSKLWLRILAFYENILVCIMEMFSLCTGKFRKQFHRWKNGYIQVSIVIIKHVEYTLNFSRIFLCDELIQCVVVWCVREIVSDYFSLPFSFPYKYKTKSSWTLNTWQCTTMLCFSVWNR